MVGDMDYLVENCMFDEEEYVDVEPALRALMRLDKRISKAVEYLKDNRIEEAVRLIDDQIIFIISTVLKKTLEDAENIYNAHTKRTRRVELFLGCENHEQKREQVMRGDISEDTCRSCSSE